MSPISRRTSAALLILLLLSSPAFAAAFRPAPPRLGAQITALVVRAWNALASLLPVKEREPGMDPNSLDVNPGAPPQTPQATAPGDGERGPGMDPWG